MTFAQFRLVSYSELEDEARALIDSDAVKLKEAFDSGSVRPLAPDEILMIVQRDGRVSADPWTIDEICDAGFSFALEWWDTYVRHYGCAFVVRYCTVDLNSRVILLSLLHLRHVHACGGGSPAGEA